MEGFDHLWRPRKFTIANQFASECFLADCHWQSSPPNAHSGAQIPTFQVMKKARPKGLTYFMAGMEGFEPPNAGTRNQCLTTWRHPITIIITYKMCCCLSFWQIGTRNHVTVKFILNFLRPRLSR